MLAGGMPPGSKDLGLARRQARDGIAAVLPHARAAGVPLALEPLTRCVRGRSLLHQHAPAGE